MAFMVRSVDAVWVGSICSFLVRSMQLLPIFMQLRSGRFTFVPSNKGLL